MRDLYRYRDLILTLVARELKVRYRRSTIGFLWTMLQPLLMMGVYDLVFSNLFKAPIPDYAIYALAGILFWNFFSQSIVSSMNSLRGNAQLLQKLPVPKAVFPLATVLSGLLNLLFALVPMLLILLITRHALSWSLLFLPVSILLAGVFTLGAGLLLSPLAVFFHDVVELIGVLLTLLMYLTPLFYRMQDTPREGALGGALQSPALDPRSVPRPDLLLQGPPPLPPGRLVQHRGRRARHRGSRLQAEQRSHPVLRLGAKGVPSCPERIAASASPSAWKGSRSATGSPNSASPRSRSTPSTG